MCRLDGSAPGLVPASYIEIEQPHEAPSEAGAVQKGIDARIDRHSLSMNELRLPAIVKVACSKIALFWKLL